MKASIKYLFIFLLLAGLQKSLAQVNKVTVLMRQHAALPV